MARKKNIDENELVARSIFPYTCRVVMHTNAACQRGLHMDFV